MNRDELIRKKKQLESRIAAIKADFAQGLDADSAERAVQLENADVLNALMTEALQQLAEINSKLLTIK